MMGVADKMSEVWLRGPIETVPVILQPVAFALMQAREEVNAVMKNFPKHLLWSTLAGLASPGFHLQHLTGVLDRLFTYAESKPLSEAQLRYLGAEGKPAKTHDDIPSLVNKFGEQVDAAMTCLKHANVNTLTEVRGVGRAALPSTIMGLYTHAAEHTMRHTGQLLVTTTVLKKADSAGVLDDLLK